MTYENRLRDVYKEEYKFTKKDASKLFSKDKISNEYLDQLLHNLVKQNKIIRITNGSYTFKKDLMVSGFAYSPFYYGLQEALSLRNLHEQETNPIIITTNKIKPGIKTIQGSNVLLRRIDCKYFFGFDFIKYYDMEIPVSDYEKTLIDFVYYNEPLSKEVINELKKKIDKKKLEKYLFRYSKSTRNKVLSLIK
jgi:predicted transcriptional regulator of viral defense system